MRAIIQRVMKASVTVGDEVVSSIGQGVCVLVGISRDDNKKDIEYIVRKILNTRVFDDDNDKRWAKSVMDKKLEVLCVSQFTLYHILKGNKPDFHSAMGGDESKAFYEEFLQQMRRAYKPEMIKDGAFGAHMQVHIQNDGPVTITIESPKQEIKERKDPRQQKGQKKSENTKNSGAKDSNNGADNCAKSGDSSSADNSKPVTSQGDYTTDSQLSDVATNKLNIEST